MTFWQWLMRRRRPARTIETVEREIADKLQPYLGSGRNQAPSISVSIASDLGDTAFGLNAGKDDLFCVGSVTKVMTGSILANAVRSGLVDLDEPVNDCLPPELHIDPRVTLRHLATHTSGLPDYPEGMGDNLPADVRRISPGTGYTTEDLARCIASGGCRSLTTPGYRFNYSNLGAGLLGIALQTRYRASAGEMFAAQLPLGMLDTSMRAGANADMVAQGHTPAGAKAGLPDMGCLCCAGEVVSSAADMTRFLRSLLGSSPMALEMRKTLAGEMGYLHRIEGGVHSKGGITAGYSAAIAWSDRAGIALLSNRGHLQLEGLARDLVGRI